MEGNVKFNYNISVGLDSFLRFVNGASMHHCSGQSLAGMTFPY